MKILLLLILLWPLRSMSQNPGFYELNGKFICSDCNVNEICKRLGYDHINLFVSAKNKYALVVYEKVTNRPLFVNVQKASEIKSVLKDFRGRNYYRDISFFMDLEDMLKERALTDIMLIQSIGKPGDVFETSDGNIKIQSYDYPKIGLTVYFVNGVGIRYFRH